ncbi:MAG: MFS transporter [Chloroflexota bacterium]
MRKTYRFFGAAAGLASQRWRAFSIGGDWALTLARDVQHNLRWFFYDGLFASASDNIINTYLTFYILALGATGAQIGYLSSLSGTISALMLLPGAFLVERLGRRKELTVLSGGGLARAMLLLLAFLPAVWTGQNLVWVAIALVLMRDAFGNLAYPAWMSMIADIVPLSGRGRYFASRNIVMGIAGMASTLVVGAFISRFAQPFGYQMALCFAFVVGMISTYSFARLRDPLARPARVTGLPSRVRFPKRLRLLGRLRVSWRVSWREIGQHKGFVMLAMTAILWNFSLNIAGPFFNVYMARELHVTPTLIAINSAASTVAGMAIQLSAGRLADRWGPRRLQLLLGFMIPLLPFAWIFVTAGWQIIPINIVGGALWGIYNLAAFNLLLELIPEAQRARYSALYQVITTVSLAAGAAFGSQLLTHFGFRALFLGSSIGRFAAAILFAFWVRPPKLQTDTADAG